MEIIQARLPQLREDATVSRAMREINAARTGASAELAMPRARKAKRPLRAADAPARDRTHLDRRVGDMRESSQDTKWKCLSRKKVVRCAVGRRGLPGGRRLERAESRPFILRRKLRVRYRRS